LNRASFSYSNQAEMISTGFPTRSRALLVEEAESWNLDWTCGGQSAASTRQFRSFLAKLHTSPANDDSPIDHHGPEILNAKLWKLGSWSVRFGHGRRFRGIRLANVCHIKDAIGFAINTASSCNKRGALRQPVGTRSRSECSKS
jgi:hypothetical protein